jgi:PAS domain S-box-containing protein
MVVKNVQTETLLELVFSASGETVEHLILKKSIPIYLRKLNCFQAGVLKSTENKLEETILIPVVASKSREWGSVKSYFANRKLSENEPCSKLLLEGSYFYAYSLSTYGVLILGRKRPFDEIFTHELEPVVNYLGMVLIQSSEIEQRKRAEKSLKESELRLRTISNTTTAGIFIFNGERIVYANRAAERLSGFSIAELMTLKMPDFVHPDFKDMFQKHILDNQPGKIVSPHFEIKILPKNREECWMDINIGVIEWEGEQAGIISAFDITRRKQVEEDLVKAKEKAEESDRLKTAFLNNISHEIRTPLNAITGFSALLTLPDNDPDSLSMYIESILKSSDHLLSIVYDIIDMSNIDARAANIQISKVNLNKLTDKLYKQFLNPASDKNLNIVSKPALPFEKADIMTDPSKLIRILSNLISNAIKFTIKGEVTYGYELKDSFVEFFVSDTGIGIPHELHSRIFEKFYQAERNLDRKFEGTGLGLSICKAFVKNLGGEIWLHSEYGNGSTFYFTVPYVKPVPPEESEVQVDEGSFPGPQNRRTALVAEDNQINFDLISAYLAKINFNVIRAVNGFDAVKICRSQKGIDLILMDIKMPGLDGFAATRQIREFLPDVLIIAQTAYSDNKEDAINSGCNDFISKPFTIEQFISKVREYIDVP